MISPLVYGRQSLGLWHGRIEKRCDNRNHPICTLHKCHVIGAGFTQVISCSRTRLPTSGVIVCALIFDRCHGRLRDQPFVHLNYTTNERASSGRCVLAFFVVICDYSRNEAVHPSCCQV
jgi:hypothetical protein